MKTTNRLLLPVFFLSALLLVSCGHDQEADLYLSTSQAQMDEHPEVALKTLESIPQDIHFSAGQKARYALLYSMALDKNYIDLTSDSLINIAVNWYKYRNDKDARFKSYYYQARIYENARDYESAIESATKANRVKGDIDHLFRARAEFVKTRIYNEIFDLEKALVAASKASEFLSLGDYKEEYAASLLEQANIYLKLKDYEQSDSLLNLANQYSDYFNQPTRRAYCDIRLMCEIFDSEASYSLLPLIEEYLEVDTDAANINWLTIASAYKKENMLAEAQDCLSLYVQYNDTSSDIAYYYLLSEVCKEQGDYERAYEALKKNASMIEAKCISVFENDAKFIEERYGRQIQLIRLRIWVSAAVMVLAILFVLSFYYVRKRKRKARHLEALFHDLEDENKDLEGMIVELEAKSEGYRRDYDSLLESYDSVKAERDSISKVYNDAREVLLKRSTALSLFLSKPVPDSLSKVAGRIEDMTKDRNKVIDSIALIYSIYYPRFVEALREKQLSISEIGYCCLLLLGLKGHEIGGVIHRSGVYNISMGIRSKIGLDTGKDGWLSAWVSRIFKEKGLD